MNTCRSGPAVPVDRTNPQNEHLDAAWVTTPASRTDRDGGMWQARTPGPEQDGTDGARRADAQPVLVTPCAGGKDDWRSRERSQRRDRRSKLTSEYAAFSDDTSWHTMDG